VNLEHLIIKLFLVDTDSYSRYSRYINTKYNNVYNKIYHTISRLKEDGKPSHTVEELALKFHVLYPVLNTAEKDSLEQTLAAIATLEVSSEQASELLTELRKRKIAEDVALKAVEVASGDGTLSELASILEDAEESEVEDLEEFVCDNLVEINAAHSTNPPYQWRLRTLNQILGGLHKGYFGFIFARPEIGKTQFIVSECTFIAPQTENGILWVNNEENGVALITRAYQATLKKPYEEVIQNAEASREEYQRKIAGRIKIYDRPDATTSHIESVVRQHRPDVVFIDQLDKVRGVKAERYDLQQKAIYQWARELAKKYNCAVMGVCQAGGTAENKKYLEMNDVDSSHTAKQGEADWMFGIGRSNTTGEEDRRFISVCKNKLPNTPMMVSSMRHAKVPIRSVSELQIYEDVINVK
jgi:replicative DNA helicase